MLADKQKDTNEIQIQQSGLLQSYLQEDMQNSLDSPARMRILKNIKNAKFNQILHLLVRMFTDCWLNNVWRWRISNIFTFTSNAHHWICQSILGKRPYLKFEGMPNWEHVSYQACLWRLHFPVKHSTANGRNRILAFGIHPKEDKECARSFSFSTRWLWRTLLMVVVAAGILVSTNREEFWHQLSITPSIAFTKLSTTK